MVSLAKVELTPRLRLASLSIPPKRGEKVLLPLMNRGGLGRGFKDLCKRLHELRTQQRKKVSLPIPYSPFPIPDFQDRSNQDFRKLSEQFLPANHVEYASLSHSAFMARRFSCLVVSPTCWSNRSAIGSAHCNHCRAWRI
jgi:hypothetical protein